MDNLTKHEKRSEELVARKTAEFLARHLPSRALVTVMGCRLSKQGSEATVFVSVLPDNQASEALRDIKRLRSDLREYLQETTKLGIVPRVDIVLNTSQTGFGLTSDSEIEK